MISREISFIGNLVGTYVDLQDLMTLTAQGQVTLHTSEYPLDAINDAMVDLGCRVGASWFLCDQAHVATQPACLPSPAMQSTLAPLPAGFKLDAGGGERLRFGEVEIFIRASAETTGGAFSIFEENAPVDTPLHVHEHEDELFYVLEGEHVFQVGEECFEVGPGGLVFAPRGIPHSQRRVVPRTGRLLVMVSPGGLEGFFRELAEAQRGGSLGQDAYATVSQKYGITWL